MKNVKNNKQKQINDIVSVVKISILLLIGIILFQNFINNNLTVWVPEMYYTVICLFIPLMVSVLIYLIWIFSTKYRFNKRYVDIINKIEIAVFIIVFSIIIFICGVNESQYKFLYLFIIITTTIQYGMKQGIVVSCISSLIILAMDIFMEPNVIVNTYFENDLILAGVFILTAWPLGFYVKIEAEHIKKLEELINIDGLTELYNHRYFCDSLAEKVKNGDRNSKPVSMIFIDIDYFKQYNDTHGHQKGDYVLRRIGEIIKSNIGEEDIAARYGGEEFSIILPDANEEEAIQVAENLRKKIECTRFYGEESQPKGKVTVSIGVSVYPYKAKNDIELIKSADDALYRAKFFNKNRVEAYTSILDEIKKNIDEKDIELVASIKTLISVINAKDRYTYGHVERVVVYSRMIADKLKLSKREKEILIYGAYMHDIGKININKEVLMKKMRLTDEEWELLKQHPANGVEIIKSVESLKDIIPLIISHHERYDGNGYPNKLKGKEIPYLARILTVVDSFDAMTSNRPYNTRKTYEEAAEELEKCSGTQFDPEISAAFIEIVRKNEGEAFIEGVSDIGEIHI
ncbi:bifunctional diguanylate cyclase/phosphohydrolase [Clostridium beijerinckii]|uniref:Diguanylate cyclase (GGDEF)-like protein n=1 Tax=Clostridium beijerinckii TaxID=1520 RepID=A0A9Q5GH14_CLOBE|nr:diguanylate cyclase [Clostridium beijerinckii]AQS06819.1 response regulator PleD [Clostridium beijerinckii]MBA2883315.1 diguanylate cyclase (GGDEF)-like protein [Clostridium beijerinckii]MBA2898501.1 diguanylate cyclase (GGDEF)-like protein [Clostridium beijerinckii]MBA2907902.1 diguanylate cyclase (GGDEF)-like protein [Clostridium beijerinckii]MBA9013551.1 diguanylate cyclase (GGDEF)-like protein [Clostridium beijerinckii]